jgi:hypothetical protein
MRGFHNGRHVGASARNQNDNVFHKWTAKQDPVLSLPQASKLQFVAAKTPHLRTVVLKTHFRPFYWH